MDLDYKVIATGSKGNAVRIENVLIDAGVPFAKLKSELHKVDTLLLSHVHSDHVKVSTVLAIKKLYPHIKVIGNYEIKYIVNLDVISNHNIPIKLKKGLEIIPFKCVHDVETQGFVLTFHEMRIVYATDTASLENAPDGEYDWFFLEANHDESKIMALMGKRDKYGYNIFSRGMNHLSSQNCKAFYYMRRRSKESPLIELHQSSRFY